MTGLLLVGAGGFGGDVAGMIEQSNGVDPKWELLGFLDDDPALHGTQVNGLRVLGGLEAAQEHPGALLGCCVADAAMREGLVERGLSLGCRWATVVHHSALILTGAVIGEGSIICPYSVVKSGAVLGRHTHINSHCSIGHQAVLGDFTTLSPHVAIAGSAHLGAGVFAGLSCSVLPRIQVGARAVIGAGAVVNRDVAPETVVAGVPARPIQGRRAALIAEAARRNDAEASEAG
ncbi:MAG: acetyltransferase [Armatimonadota bacterium]